MARKLRVEYPGAIYHLLSRGDRREPIFLDDGDRSRFIHTLADACTKTGWQVHAYVLMPNHFHLVIETPKANLVTGMKWLLGTYTCRFNRRHKLSGHLFAGRYKSLIVDGSGNGYLKSVCDYVHLNPARARLVEAELPLSTYLWSSWPAYLSTPPNRPLWLRVDRLLGEWGIPRDSPTGRERLEEGMEVRRSEDGKEEFKAIRRGWYLGTDAFRKELLAQMTDRLGREHYGAERTQTAEARAEAIIAAGLKRLRWREADLLAKSKGDPNKVALAAKLRAETTLTTEWIARRLSMGARTHLNHLLYQHRHGSKTSQY